MVEKETPMDSADKSLRSSSPTGRRRRNRWAVCFAWLLLAAPFGEIAADVLVLKDGSRVTTKGSWEVKGQQVLFELPNGTLSAVRLSEVDLDASEAATKELVAQAERGAEEAEIKKRKPAKEPVLVVTNSTLGLGPEGVADPVATLDSLASGTGSTGAVSSEGDVRLVEWSYGVAADDAIFEVVGTVENRGRYIAENVSVHLDIVAIDEESGLKDPDRHLLRRAQIGTSQLEPGATSAFRYAVTARDLSVHGEEGFENPVVSFDIQFQKGEVPTDESELEETTVDTAAGEPSDPGSTETTSADSGEGATTGEVSSSLDDLDADSFDDTPEEGSGG